MKRASGITSKPSAPRSAGFAVRQLACLVMLLAILVRAAVPAGFMPVFDGDQRVMTVAMCSGHADQTIAQPSSHCVQVFKEEAAARAAAIRRTTE